MEFVSVFNNRYLFGIKSTLIIECKAQINLVRNIKLVTQPGIDKPAQRLIRECKI